MGAGNRHSSIFGGREGDVVSRVKVVPPHVVSKRWQEVIAARKLLLLLQHASRVAFSIIIIQSPLLLERNDNERGILVMHNQYEY